MSVHPYTNEVTWNNLMSTNQLFFLFCPHFFFGSTVLNSGSCTCQACSLSPLYVTWKVTLKWPTWAGCQWLTPIIVATQEAEIKRISVSPDDGKKQWMLAEVEGWENIPGIKVIPAAAGNQIKRHDEEREMFIASLGHAVGYYHSAHLQAGSRYRHEL
jgi:hypothetical protein